MENKQEVEQPNTEDLAEVRKKMTTKLRLLMPTVILDYVNNSEAVQLQDCQVLADQILNIKGLRIEDKDQSLPDMVFYCKTCDKMVKNTLCNIVDEGWVKCLPKKNLSVIL